MLEISNYTKNFIKDYDNNKIIRINIGGKRYESNTLYWRCMSRTKMSCC